MTDIFKTKWDKADMEAADDPQFAPASAQVPSDVPGLVSPSLWAKRRYPQHVENIQRPRFGKGY